MSVILHYIISASYLVSFRNKNVLFCIVLYCFVLFCIVLYCNALYCIVMHCIALYCILLYCIVLYCILCYCIVNKFVIVYIINKFDCLHICIYNIGSNNVLYYIISLFLIFLFFSTLKMHLLIYFLISQ